MKYYNIIVSRDSAGILRTSYVGKTTTVKDKVFYTDMVNIAAWYLTRFTNGKSELIYLPNITQNLTKTP